MLENKRKLSKEIEILEKSKIEIDLMNKGRRILLVDDEPYNIMGL